MSKNYNYIAALERAIGKKYGELSTINPAKFWNEDKEREYIEQTKELFKEDFIKTSKELEQQSHGLFISSKLINREIERVCEVCEVYSFNLMDDIYQTKFGCCYECYIKYVHRMEERWKSGWRPNNVKREENE